MRILLIHNTYQYPGGEDVVFDREQRLLERAGHEVITYRRSNREIESYSRIKCTTLPLRAIWSTEARREIVQLLRQEKPDLAHIHNTFMMISPSIYSACQEADVPVVQTLHNYRLLCPESRFFRNGDVCEECLQFGLQRGIRHGCYRGSRLQTTAVALMLGTHRKLHTWSRLIDCYIALTEFSRTKFIAGGIPPEKIAVKPHFVDDPGPRNGTGENAVFVGRLSYEKGTGTLIKAWRSLRVPAPLDIIGDGPLRHEFEHEARKFRLSEIRFRGQLTIEQSVAAIQSARFLILPSECYESFSLVIGEAFACGTPVICSRRGVMAEVVTDGVTGLHFNPGDPEDLSRKVDWAFANPDAVAVMGKEARNEYERKYTPEKGYTALMQIYRRAMTAHSELRTE